jgi:hypothetical protein
MKTLIVFVGRIVFADSPQENQLVVLGGGSGKGAARRRNRVFASFL